MSYSVISRNFLADRKNKYAKAVRDYLSFFYQLYFSRLVNEKLGKGAVKCRSVSEAIKPASYYRIFCTINRYWLWKTLRRIKDAGLDAKQIEFNSWNNLLKEKNEGLIEGALGLIEMGKFLPVFVLWALVAVFSATVFFFEKVKLRCEIIII